MTPVASTANQIKARAAWGDAIPDWVVMLAEICDRSSQNKAAAHIGYSPGVVNAVLKNVYPADLTKVQRAVEGAFGKLVVECPVLGEVKANICITHQRKRLTTGHAMSIRLWRACRSGCAHFRGSTNE